MRLAAAAAHFGRDLPAALQRVEAIIGAARQAGAALLVLPDGTLGGYLDDLHCPDHGTLPVPLDPADPVFEKIAALAGELVVCLGFCERGRAGGQCGGAGGTGGQCGGAGGAGGAGGIGNGGYPARYNAAVCLSGAGIHGRHRKVHLAAGEAGVYTAGDDFAAFDTPIGRVGMLIDYDKTFPEAARALALDEAQVLACLSAWPASVTDPARRVVKDRQARLFDLYDCARAAENQLVLASANQTGSTGRLRFLGQAKVVGPGGEVRARTWSKAGLAVADIDIPAELARSRRTLHHLAELRPHAYRS